MEFMNENILYTKGFCLTKQNSMDFIKSRYKDICEQNNIKKFEDIIHIVDFLHNEGFYIPSIECDNTYEISKCKDFPNDFIEMKNVGLFFIFPNKTRQLINLNEYLEIPEDKKWKYILTESDKKIFQEKKNEIGKNSYLNYLYYMAIPFMDRLMKEEYPKKYELYEQLKTFADKVIIYKRENKDNLYFKYISSYECDIR